MASRKGIGVTIVFLVGVVAASFLVYLLPEDTTMKISVSDFEKHLDITKERASMEVTGIDDSFKKLINDEMNPDEYISIAEISSSQLNSLIIELTNSGATQEWTESYINYIGALKKLNGKIMETIVVANMMKGEYSTHIGTVNYGNEIMINEIRADIIDIEIELQDLIKKSDNTRP